MDTDALPSSIPRGMRAVVVHVAAGDVQGRAGERVDVVTSGVVVVADVLVVSVRTAPGGEDTSVTLAVDEASARTLAAVETPMRLVVHPPR
jgi:hypothetical protein